jgi:restriction system protein
MLPLLQLAGDGAEHRTGEAIALLADYMGLSDDERAALAPGGGSGRFAHRVHYAKRALKRAGLLESCAHGSFRITALGLRALERGPLHIDRAFLSQYPGFADPAPDPAGLLPPLDDADADIDIERHTPRELIDILYRGLGAELADELLDAALSASPAFFERLVIDLLLAMGYGGALGRAAAARHLGRSGDGGLDGVIQQDRLGLDLIYVQAKRWARASAVGRPVIQAFVGSLIGVGAGRGVLLTTGRFSPEAVEYARGLQNHAVILIDGARLAELMIEHNVGVAVEQTVVIKRLDSAYFDSE